MADRTGRCPSSAAPGCRAHSAHRRGRLGTCSHRLSPWSGSHLSQILSSKALKMKIDDASTYSRWPSWEGFMALAGLALHARKVHLKSPSSTPFEDFCRWKIAHDMVYTVVPWMSSFFEDQILKFHTLIWGAFHAKRGYSRLSIARK